MNQEYVDEVRERSKRDDAFIAGSEIRACLCFLEQQLTEAKKELVHIYITADEYYHIKWDCGHIGAYSPRRHCPYCEIANEAEKREGVEQENKRLRDSLESAYDMLDAICDTPTDRQALKEEMEK